MRYLKNWIPLVFLLTIFIYTPSSAQDSVNVDELEFTTIVDSSQIAPPVAKATVAKVAPKEIKKQAPAEKKTLWVIFIAGLVGGCIALIMPCIYPMLPMTVSFFTKGAEGGGGVKKAIIYGVSIIVIYVSLGLLITVSFGPDTLNGMSTNGIFNFFFFLLLVFFAASLLGAFELVLPSSWVNKMDQKSDKGGLLGIFFMAATLSLVSFSCTGPVIGGLLVEAATTGALLGPAVGMLGFSFALALPFTLFAMFPSLLKSLPKSGGWLNSVKVVLGFLELAFALKFLSNVDLAYHWKWFDREVFLVLWIVIFALLGIYLLGKIRFSHDSPIQFVSVPRLFMAIIALSFSVYMVPGLWGAPLKSVSAFLPPMATQDFDLSSGVGSTIAESSGNHKYADLFDKPKGFDPFFDYDEGIAYAKKIGKPVMIDFTGHACVNCRKMEADVWPDPRVSGIINKDYVLIQLYVDDKTDLPEAEQTTTPEGRSIKTIANKNSYLQTSKFQANSQPFYVLLDPKTEQPLVTPQGADFDTNAYFQYLESGIKAYNGN